MADDSDDAIRERLRVARARYKKEPAAYDPALVPTADLLGPRRLDSGLTTLKERIDREVSIIDIYSRFMPAHKVRPAPKSGQRESIKFSCPSPSHPDEHPSAWTNIDGLWYCEPCGAKGDKYTVAAIGSGLDTRHDFPEVCTRIADAFGIDYARPVSTPRIHVVSEPVPIDIKDAFPEPPRVVPLLDTNKLFPVGTFARQFMDDTLHDDCPREFYAWGSLLALGLGIGRDCALQDSPRVQGNLYVCFYSDSGTGKSRSMNALKEVIRGIPYDYVADPPSKGIKWIGNPGSAESAIDAFSRPIIDPSTSAVMGYASVRGIISVDELTNLLSRGDRSSPIKGQLTSFYDSDFAHITSRLHKDVRAEGIFCSLLTSTQPLVVAEYLKVNDLLSGFANRIIFVMGVPLPQIAVREIEFNASRSIDALLEVHRWASFNRYVAYDAAGQALFEEFFHDVLLPMRQSKENPLFTRIDLTIKKIILLLAANEKSIIADADIVGRAVQFYDYLKYTYEELGGSVASSNEAIIVAWVDKFIRNYVGKHGKAPTGSEIARGARDQFTPKDLLDALTRQARLGSIYIEDVKTTGKGGRPTQRYWMTDQLKDE